VERRTVFVDATDSCREFRDGIEMGHAKTRCGAGLLGRRTDRRLRHGMEEAAGDDSAGPGNSKNPRADVRWTGTLDDDVHHDSGRSGFFPFDPLKLARVAGVRGSVLRARDRGRGRHGLRGMYSPVKAWNIGPEDEDRRRHRRGHRAWARR